MQNHWQTQSLYSFSVLVCGEKSRKSTDVINDGQKLDQPILFSRSLTRFDSLACNSLVDDFNPTMRITCIAVHIHKYMIVAVHFHAYRENASI